jgi:2-polyprenyl-3-methyl-5-hydroxy-6-metoxy-1,4-benzoquinol methylase
MKSHKRAYSDIAKEQCERTAREYYAFRKKGDTPNDLVEIPAMKRLIGTVTGKRLIDCGCGFGTYSVYCAKQGAIVTAIDISETMIELAKQQAAEAGVQIDFRVQDVTNLRSLGQNTFDIAISSNAVCFGMPLFLKEAAQVLKPKGVLCLSDVHPLLNAKFGDYLDRRIRTANNVFGKLNPSDPDYQWQWEHYTLEDYSVGLKEAGFLIEELLEPKPDPTMRPLNPELYDRACRNPMFVLIRAVRMERTGP